MWQKIAVYKWGPMVSVLRACVVTDWAAYCRRRMSLRTIKCPPLPPSSIFAPHSIPCVQRCYGFNNETGMMVHSEGSESAIASTHGLHCQVQQGDVAMHPACRRSPFMLGQEEFPDPWQHLVCCLLCR